MRPHSMFFAACCVAVLSVVTSFYLPGVLPVNFKIGDPVALKVNALTSVDTLLPYDFYDLPFCKPAGGVKDSAENLGEYLTGNRIENSAYQLSMRVEESCKVLCRMHYTEDQAQQFREKIKEGYYTNWVVDNIPAGTEIYDADANTETTYYNRGFPVGKIDGSRVELYNHLRLTVYYHGLNSAGEELAPGDTAAQADELGSSSGGDDVDTAALWAAFKGFRGRRDAGSRIVRFMVEPFSVKHQLNSTARFDEDGRLLPEPSTGAPNKFALLTCSPRDPITEFSRPEEAQLVDTATEVIWSYDVHWEPSDVRWASRWDIYLSMNGMYSDDIHWFSVSNAILIVLFLSALIGMILRRTLHADINRYNRVPTEEDRAEEREESGWKLVHADVFRPPPINPMFFAVVVGSGAQLILCGFVTTVFAAIGFLSPSNRGGLMIALLVMYVLGGAAAGYHSAATYKLFKGKEWQRCTLLTSFAFPGTCFFVFFFLNLIVWAEGSVRAVPFGSLLAVVLLWFGVSIPLVFLGAFFGYKAESVELPVATSNIPRLVPDQPWYMSLSTMATIGGILPFGAVFVELYFILTSLWLDQYYYVFGFLLLAFAIMLLTAAEITLVLIYFQLCGEDYHWWWRCFVTGGSTAGYVFLYSAYYFFTSMRTMWFTAALLYFGYMFLVSLALFLLMGATAYMVTFFFLRKIYGAIKVD